MLVSVVIPAHQSNDYLKKCLKSINSQNYSNYEVIVVSDNSKEVEDYLEILTPQLIVLVLYFAYLIVIIVCCRLI